MRSIALSLLASVALIAGCGGGGMAGDTVEAEESPMDHKLLTVEP
jgi:hypothetical protein